MQKVKCHDRLKPCSSHINMTDTSVTSSHDGDRVVFGNNEVATPRDSSPRCVVSQWVCFDAFE